MLLTTVISHCTSFGPPGSRTQRPSAWNTLSEKGVEDLCLCLCRKTIAFWSGGLFRRAQIFIISFQQGPSWEQFILLGWCMLIASNQRML